MAREIVVENKTEILIHRYNTRDDTYISYFKPKNLGVVYKNLWVAKGNSITYRKKLMLTDDEKAMVKLGA